MARIRMTGTPAASIPTPPSGKATLFYDDADRLYKAKLDDGNIIVLSVNEEYVQDIVGEFFQDSSTVTVIYDDFGNVISTEVVQSALDLSQIPNLPSGNLTSTTAQDALYELQLNIDDVQDTVDNILLNAEEAAQDAIGNAIGAGTQDGVQVVYDDAGNKINFTNTNKGSDAVSSHESDPDPHAQYLQKSDNVLVDPQIVRVKISNAGAGEFTDLALALASITDADPETKPYIVKLGAGNFTVNNPIVVPAGVSIEGEAINTTSVSPIDPDEHLFVMGNLCELSFLNLKGISGSIGSGKAAIYCEDSGDFVQLHKLSIYGFDIGIDNYANTTDSIVYIEYCDINGDFTRAVRNVANSTNLARLQVENFYTYESTATDAIHCYSSGINAELIMNSTGLLGGEDNVGIGVDNGGIALISDSLLRNFTGTGSGFKNFNVGAGTDIDLNGAQFISNTKDLQILNPASQTALNVTADSEKLEVASGAAFTALITDSTYGGILSIGEVTQGDTLGATTPIGTLISKTGTTGAYQGGVVSAGVGLSVDVSAGQGFCYDVTNDYMAKVTWNPTNFSGLSPDTTYWICVDSSGTVQAQTSSPGLVNKIYLARVRTGASSILWTGRAIMNSLHHGNSLENFARNMGAIYISGSVVVENGTRGLDVSSGRYQYGTVIVNPSGGSAVEWTLVNDDGSGGHAFTTSQTQVDNQYYDDGSGTLANMSSGYYRKDALYTSGDGVTEKLFLVKGAAEYDSLVLAEAAGLPIPPDWFSGTICLIASIIQQEGAANIEQIRSERPFLGFQASGLSASSDHGNLIGLADDDHTQYLLVDGTRPMSGPLNLGNNVISNVTTINSVIVENHASRHLPNGADPLATGTPSTVGTANTTGTANALARQDHVHSHGNQTTPTHHAVATTSANGFLSSTDKTKIDGIEPGATADQNASEVPFTPTGNIASTNVQNALNELDTEKQSISEKGQANGYAGLDGSGKVPTDQLPDVVLGAVKYQSTWDANTNTPDLTSITPNKGDYYIVSTAGTTSLGGITDWQVGDWVIYNGTVWEKVDNTDQVTSVFGRQGSVTAQSGDYNAGQITNTPSGNITSTNVQAALNELDTKKANKTLSISAGAGLTGGGDLSANRTISMPNVGTAGTNGSSSSTLTVTTDAQGRVTNVVVSAISIASTAVTDFANAVRNTILTGYVVGTNAAITAADTILQAFGKIQAQVTAHITNTSNPHSVTKAQVGLSNVDNTSDANKPISTATQTALNLKSDTTHTHPNGTQTVPGFMSTGDKTKIDGVQAGATANSTDAQLRDRSTHTGTQLASTISDFAVTVRSTVLTGVSFVDSLIVATDSILVGIGKLQGQITQAIANSTAALALKANLAGGNTFTGAQRIEGGFTVKEPANTALVLAADGGGGNFVSFEFKPFEGRTGGSSSRIVGLDNNFSSDLIFYNAQTGAGTNVAIERMRLGADGQLSVGTGAPSASAKVQIDSTTQGFLPPRVTTAQRNAIATPAAGLVVYDTSLNQMHYYNGTQWIPWNIFGQGYAFFSDLTAFSTTSGTNVVAATFPYTAPDVGTYRIDMQWNFTTNSTTNSARFQTFVDGVAQSSLIEVEVKDATDDLTYNVFTNVALTAGAHTIELRVNMENFSTLTVSIVKCEVWRVL